MYSYKIWFIFLAVFISACVSMPKPSNERQFKTNVRLSEYNQYSQRYMPKATAGKVQFISGVDVYHLMADRYGNGYLGISVEYPKVDDFIESVEKYLRWSAVAKENNDVLSKIITYIRPLNGGVWQIKFDSYGDSNQYIVFSACGSEKSENCLFFAALDDLNAQVLINELRMFKDGSLLSVGLEDRYK
ncbi:hypothetical protein [Thalassolituus marinus]|uniref:Lipoprotein n=1 Tax=Thalassolituus marinus TaxID=671053 RepID=A0ABS7ZPM7_9GAMM|nr:hypothetical protein [Thalassolituus marinus]MCA6063652.1 hypothetical protein [Thalassolituus marinus]